MKDNDYYLRCAWRMETEGGSFAHYIARAFYCADRDNWVKLVQTFGPMFERFAPREETVK